MIEEYMDKIAESAKEDKEKAIQLRYDYDGILHRLRELEDFSFLLKEQQNGKTGKRVGGASYKKISGRVPASNNVSPIRS